MKRIYLLLMTVAVFGLSSCKHKDLCYSHPHTTSVNIVFDWLNAPGANPETMRLYLFPENGGNPLRYEFVNITGGSIDVPAGKYKAFCLNSDTESLLYRETNNWNTFEIYSPATELLRSLGLRSDTAPRADGTEEEGVVTEAEKLFTDRIASIDIKMGIQQTITFYPVVSVSSYTYEIRNVENLKYVKGMTGSISGMAGGMLVGGNTLTEPACIIPFGATISLPSVISGSFITFGYNSTKIYFHRLVIYAVLSDNSKWYYTYDVTDQVRNAPDPLNVHIVLDGLPLPKPLENGSGFQPDVDEWGNVDENIDM